MIKRKAEVDPLKSYNADSGLIGYLDKRLKLSKEMEQLDAAGKEFPSEINARDKSLRTKKVRILDIVFQAMADLTFFFKTISLHPELLEVLDSDIKDLLGIRHKSSHVYGFMILDLLRSILIVEDGQKGGSIKRDDFRLSLNNKIQGIVLDKANRSLPLVFNNDRAEHIVWDDLGRAWAWTRMLAIDKEFGDPHRTFNFDSSELLKE